MPGWAGLVCSSCFLGLRLASTVPGTDLLSAGIHNTWLGEEEVCCDLLPADERGSLRALHCTLRDIHVIHHCTHQTIDMYIETTTGVQKMSKVKVYTFHKLERPNTVLFI